MRRSVKLTMCVAAVLFVALPAVSAMAFDFGDILDLLKFKTFCRHPVSDVPVGFGGIDNPLTTDVREDHMLYPNDVTITVDGTVTFTVVGGGHRIAIYSVSMNTDRKDIEKDLLPNCVDLSGAACTNSSRYFVTDAKGNLIIDTNPIFPPFPAPANSGVFKYEVGRLVFESGANDGSLTAGTNFTYTFPKPGKYLVVCGNRGHFLSDSMYGFVNVVDCDDFN